MQTKEKKRVQGREVEYYCPKCGSKRLVKAGICRLRMGNKQRWLCRRCNKISINPKIRRV